MCPSALCAPRVEQTGTTMAEPLPAAVLTLEWFWALHPQGRRCSPHPSTLTERRGSSPHWALQANTTEITTLTQTQAALITLSCSSLSPLSVWSHSTAPIWVQTLWTELPEMHPQSHSAAEMALFPFQRMSHNYGQLKVTQNLLGVRNVSYSFHTAWQVRDKNHQVLINRTSWG